MAAFQSPQGLKPRQKPFEINEEICTCDIETAKAGEVLDIGFYDGQNYRTFDSWLSMFAWLNNHAAERRINVIWAHNGGGFDWVNLTREFHTSKKLRAQIKGHCNVAAMIISSSILQLSVTLLNGHVIRFQDSFRLMPSSLASLLKDFGLEHKHDVPKEYRSDMGRYKQEYAFEYYEYLHRDVIGLHEVLGKFRHLCNTIAPIGDLPLSLGSMALKAFRFFLEHEIRGPGKQEREFTRRAYGGGRTEFFGGGKPEIISAANGAYYYDACNYYDFNSKYPAVMLYGDYPTAPGSWVKKLVRLENGKIAPGCYEVQYRQLHGAVAAVRPDLERNGKIYRSKTYQFEGSAVLTHIELNYLEEIGAEIKCARGIVYTECEPIFAQYIGKLYAMRLEARQQKQTALVYVIKLLMNNLYGKFGQSESGERIEILDIDTAAEYMNRHDEGITITELEEIDSERGLAVYLIEEPTLPRHAFPAIAAFITAQARIDLTRLADRYSDSVIYCDTDSIVLHRTEIDPALIDDKALGMLKPEHLNEPMLFWGRKGYALLGEQKTKQKGVPKSAFDLNAARRIQHGQVVKCLYDSPTPLKTAVRSGNRLPSHFAKRFRHVRFDPPTFQSRHL